LAKENISLTSNKIVIHPDKTSHPRAPEAFDLLKKVNRVSKNTSWAFDPTLPQAESELSNKDKREELDAVINQARSLVLKSLDLPVPTPDSDRRLKNLVPPFKTLLRAQSKDLLIDEEVRRRK
jgi:DnaJ homolog subfamily C member 8